MSLKNLSIFLLILTICFSSCLSVEEPNIITPDFVENPEAVFYSFKILNDFCIPSILVINMYVPSGILDKSTVVC